jgi:hypothetical protein
MVAQLKRSETNYNDVVGYITGAKLSEKVLEEVELEQ